MRPVTIKSEQLIDGLWITQGLLALTSVVVLWSAVVTHPVLLVALLVVVVGFYTNHQRIKQRQQHHLSISQSGQFNLSRNEQLTAVKLRSYWQLPGLFLLHFSTGSNKSQEMAQSIHFLCWRQRLGAAHFSSLLVGVTQQQDSNNDI